MFILYDNEMNKLDFPDGVKPLDIFISSLQKERTTQTVEGVHGAIDFGAEYRDREIRLTMLLKSFDTQDYRLQRDEVYNLLDQVAYVSEEYQAGKRYSVRIDESYIPERFDNNQTFATAEINCATVGLPFAESILSTQDIEKEGLKYGQGWFYGMGLQYDESTHKYTHSNKRFKIYNAGNVEVHPFESFLKIKVGNITDGYQLKNLTNGSSFKYTGEASGDIEHFGSHVTMGKRQVLRDTDKKFIFLEKGWNEFEQSTIREVSFDFRFLYK